MQPVVTIVGEGECDWTVTDRYGEFQPHGTKAWAYVSGLGEMWDGRYCRRHLKEAIERSQHGPDPEF